MIVVLFEYPCDLRIFNFCMVYSLCRDVELSVNVNLISNTLNLNYFLSINDVFS